jgi:hypothetical protein
MLMEDKFSFAKNDKTQAFSEHYYFGRAVLEFELREPHAEHLSCNPSHFFP